MISLDDMRPAWRRPAGAQQRRLPLWHKRLAEIIDLAKNLDDPIQHHRLRHSAMAAYLKKPFSHNPLIERKPLIRVFYEKLLTSSSAKRVLLEPRVLIHGRNAPVPNKHANLLYETCTYSITPKSFSNRSYEQSERQCFCG